MNGYLSMRVFKDMIQAHAVRQLLEHVGEKPETDVLKILRQAKRVDTDHLFADYWETIEQNLKEPGNNWHTFMHKVLSVWNPYVRKKLFESLLCNAVIAGIRETRENSEKYGVRVPWAMLVDPTSHCNRKCKGCCVAAYGQEVSLNTEVIDRVVTEARELGIRMFIFSGGEPLIRKEDIIGFCEKHPDCYFLACTNGTLVDEAFANEMLRVGNLALAISVEGDKEETDKCCGEGTYRIVMDAMELLHRKGLVFGVSTCYHRKNTYEVGAAAYVDLMVRKGAAFIWYFAYMPVGHNADATLVVTPEQRSYIHSQMCEFRHTKPIVTLDFWNEGKYTKGCIAGRYYFHINANGDVEPCAFIHYSNVNIKNNTLLDALRTPLFQEFRNRQPFNSNHLRPCPLLDNPESLKEMICRTHAYSTHMQEPEQVDELVQKCRGTSWQWSVIAKELWNNGQIMH